MSDSLGGVVSYTYDARDELTNETLSGTGISAEAVAFTYDNAGNMTGLTRYSNLAETIGRGRHELHLRFRQPDDGDHRQELRAGPRWSRTPTPTTPPAG